MTKTTALILAASYFALGLALGVIIAQNFIN